MKIETARFGEVEVQEEAVLNFPEGLIGFNEEKHFVVLEHKPGSPFRWLQSLDNAALAFLIIRPEEFMTKYSADFLESDLEALKIESTDDVVIYTTVIVPEDPRYMSTNLLGPILVNSKNNLGKQVILSTDKYTTCHYIVDELLASSGVKNASTLAQT